jgi:Raf kinase inhibitor-like YbhB/YbcL family protein
MGAQRPRPKRDRSLITRGQPRHMLAAMKRILVSLVLVSCGGSTVNHAPRDGASGDAPTTDTPAGGFALTSTAFAGGTAIPTANSCKGADTSPPLAWTGAPSGAKSFAVVLTDTSLAPELQHWVIYNIPPTATGLPASVEKAYMPSNVPGAQQTTSYDDTTRGYLGPCPPVAHNYEFAVYALDVATLPGGSAQTTRQEALASIIGHKLASATLSGSFKP